MKLLSICQHVKPRFFDTIGQTREGDEHVAELDFHYGVMNSRKSLEVLTRAYNYEETGLRIAALKPAIDDKGDDHIVTRSGLSRKADFLIAPEMDVRQEIQLLIARKAIEQLHAVIVDESQFLKPGQVDQLHDMAEFDEIPVHAYGLLSDFRTELFPGSKRLMELAHNKIELQPPMCGSSRLCNTRAQFNCRQIDGLFVFEGDQVAIDGQDEGKVAYTPLCHKCRKEEEKLWQERAAAP